MWYKCKHFKLEELVPPSIIRARGVSAWELLDERALRTLDKLWLKWGTMTINDYLWGGDNMWRGLRSPESPDYSQTSQHTFCRAYDVIFKNFTADEVRLDIIANPHSERNQFIRAIENSVSWLHFDTRNRSNLLVFGK